jgi:addiction module HigA family antidote
MARRRFVPDYEISPGEILREYLEALGMSVNELAGAAEIPIPTVHAILLGEARITSEVATRLGCVLGRPAHFRQNLERLYRTRRSPRSA